MNDMPSGLKALYLNLRIKHKMFVLISFVMLMVCLCSLAVMEYVFRVYDKEMYAQSSQSLNVTAYGVENELKKMETLSFRIATDPTIQQNLGRVRAEGTSYDYFRISELLKERMIELGNLDKYVLSMQIIDTRGSEIATGKQVITLSDERIAHIQEETAPALGGNQWIFPTEQDRSLIATRQIRSFANLDLNRLGEIAIRIDLHKLIGDYARGLDTEGSQFFLMHRSGSLLTGTSALPLDQVNEVIESPNGYEIVQSAGKRFFVTYVPSDYAEWTYVIQIPYDTMFKTILNVQKLVLVVFSTLFVVAIIFAVRFARGVTRPIESLNAKMKQVQKGNFDYAEESDGTVYPMDEAGQLHRNFRIMIQRIDELITENYTKQLAMRESEYKALQAQINPHFLYNTLESINWLARMAGQRHISRMVEALAHLLRNAISHKEPVITLREELAIVRHYITIQQIRFEERLCCRVELPEKLEACLVPKMIVQPLVENAIQYGLEQMLGDCIISITVEAVDEHLEIRVEDNGPGMDPAHIEGVLMGEVPTKGSGIGLRNIDERIRHLYGEGCGVTIGKPEQGALIILRMPARWKEEETHV